MCDLFFEPFDDNEVFQRHIRDFLDAGKPFRHQEMRQDIVDVQSRHKAFASFATLLLPFFAEELEEPKNPAKRDENGNRGVVEIDFNLDASIPADNVNYTI